MNITANQIVDFWFSEPVSRLWFNSTAAFDEQLRRDYFAVYTAAMHDRFSDWQDTALGVLALAIIFDQFPLNMFRGKPEAFASEARAVAVARHAIDSKLDQQLEDRQKVFLYMPFMHSESLTDQDLSVALFEAAGLKENLRFAKHHRDIVRRFGRFPHRNAILGRESRPEEIAYLASDEAFTG